MWRRVRLQTSPRTPKPRHGSTPSPQYGFAANDEWGAVSRVGLVARSFPQKPGRTSVESAGVDHCSLQMSDRRNAFDVIVETELCVCVCVCVIPLRPTWT